MRLPLHSLGMEGLVLSDRLMQPRRLPNTYTKQLKLVASNGGACKKLEGFILYDIGFVKLLLERRIFHFGRGFDAYERPYIGSAITLVLEESDLHTFGKRDDASN